MTSNTSNYEIVLRNEVDSLARESLFEIEKVGQERIQKFIFLIDELEDLATESGSHFSYGALGKCHKKIGEIQERLGLFRDSFRNLRKASKLYAVARSGTELLDHGGTVRVRDSEEMLSILNQFDLCGSYATKSKLAMEQSNKMRRKAAIYKVTENMSELRKKWVRKIYLDKI